MTITVYRSTDAGAPVFAPNSQTSLIGVLDACLVNGYGTKPAAGWTKVYSGTRAGSTDPWTGSALAAAAYKMPAGSTGMYMYIAEAKHCWYIQGYESMSSIDHTSATGPFPRTSMLYDGGAAEAGWYGYKTDDTSTTTAIPWELITNGSFFYFLYQPRSTTFWNTVHGGRQRAQMMFGDIVGYKAGDPYKCICAGMGKPTSGTPAGHILLPAQLNTSYSSYLSALMPSNGYDRYSGVGSSPLTIARTSDAVLGGARVFPMYNWGLLDPNASSYGPAWGGMLPFPNPVDGGVYMEPIQIREYIASINLNAIRGKFPGLYMLHHGYGAIDVGQPFNGTGAHAGKTFEIFGWSGAYNVATPTTSGGLFPGVVIETTPTGDWLS